MSPTTESMKSLKMITLFHECASQAKSSYPALTPYLSDAAFSALARLPYHSIEQFNQYSHAVRQQEMMYPQELKHYTIPESGRIVPYEQVYARVSVGDGSSWVRHSKELLDMIGQLNRQIPQVNTAESQHDAPKKMEAWEALEELLSASWKNIKRDDIRAFGGGLRLRLDTMDRLAALYLNHGRREEVDPLIEKRRELVESNMGALDALVRQVARDRASLPGYVRIERKLILFKDKRDNTVKPRNEAMRSRPDLGPISDLTGFNPLAKLIEPVACDSVVCYGFDMNEQRRFMMFTEVGQEQDIRGFIDKQKQEHQQTTERDLKAVFYTRASTLMRIDLLAPTVSSAQLQEVFERFGPVIKAGVMYAKKETNEIFVGGRLAEDSIAEGWSATGSGYVEMESAYAREAMRYWHTAAGKQRAQKEGLTSATGTGIEIMEDHNPIIKPWPL